MLHPQDRSSDSFTSANSTNTFEVLLLLLVERCARTLWLYSGPSLYSLGFMTMLYSFVTVIRVKAISPLSQTPTANKDKLCLNEGLLKTEREPHGITKMSDGRMRALDTAESNAITT